MSRRRFELPDGTKLDYPPAIGFRSVLVHDGAGGKWRKDIRAVEYHTIWEARFLLALAGKLMGEANIRRLCREGELQAVKFSAELDDFVDTGAAQSLPDSTSAWQIPVSSLIEYFERHGLRCPRVPADIAFSPVVTPPPVQQPQVPADVAPALAIVPLPAERPQVPVGVAPGLAAASKSVPATTTRVMGSRAAKRAQEEMGCLKAVMVLVWAAGFVCLVLTGIIARLKGLW
jgi:hypothetical protein